MLLTSLRFEPGALVYHIKDKQSRGIIIGVEAVEKIHVMWSRDPIFVVVQDIKPKSRQLKTKWMSAPQAQYLYGEGQIKNFTCHRDRMDGMVEVEHWDEEELHMPMPRDRRIY